MLTTPTHHLRAPGDALSLALYRGEPPEPAPELVERGPILLVHGLGEHAGRYGETAVSLRAMGYQVWALDQRGHGQSAGPRGGLPSPLALLADLEAAIAHVQEVEAWDGPITLLGHSMGGAVCARFVARWAREGRDQGPLPVQRLILSSPALALGLSPWMGGVARIARRLVPGLGLSNGLKVHGISRDPAVVEAYRTDPLVHDRITPALAGFLLDTEREVLAQAPRWPVPTLVLWSGADLLVDPQGSATFVAAAPSHVVRGQVFPDLYHEILNEPEHAGVLQVMQRWLDTGEPS